MKEFSGGLYAVTRCTLARIVETWQALHQWAVSEQRPGGRHQWLEEGLTLPGRPPEETIMELYYPLGEA